ncbi:MAG: thiamine pyrophosphate-requiring protein [Proteobacteria bacterium]|nr:thiamine pyrophosphate-requiring protein [Pseudomonadota bacterium]NIS69305.1 thiamine pyrophosphate-requiring protein [Pseudomonadota bacterium]
MDRNTVKVETTAQAYLELLNQRGIEYFFANAGTDFAPLIDAFARQTEEGRSFPKPITVPHENAAVAMAHGYYMVTGKPQVVMVHVNVGTANAANGIINAARDNVPILFTAGRTPITEEGLPGTRDLYIHWGQETFDQAGMLREYVKWDYELRNVTQLETVVDRALEIAMTQPQGPVYLTLPREVLAEPQTEFTMSSTSRRDLTSRIHPDPAAIEAAATMLSAAQNPLIITTSVGRNLEAVKHLVTLAESFAIPVVTFNQRYMCFPTDHPMHLGFNPNPFLEKADTILVIDSEVPWYPSVKKPHDNCKVIQMGIDPIYANYPIRTFPYDVAIRSDSSVAIPILTEALSSYPKQAQRRIEECFKRVKAIHDEKRAAWRGALERVKEDSPLDPIWISHCINEIKDDETIIVNEYDLTLTQVEFKRPGTFFGSIAAGGLGWGLGASIGAKLGAPDRLVISVLGDGSYIFGNPTACHFVSQAEGLPTLTVIFNNGGWNAVRRANLRMYPEGWAARTKSFPLSDLKPSPQFEVVAAASGGYGERVEKASEVRPALERAVKAVREDGRQAVLNLICKHP